AAQIDGLDEVAVGRGLVLHRRRHLRLIGEAQGTAGGIGRNLHVALDGIEGVIAADRLEEDGDAEWLALLLAAIDLAIGDPVAALLRRRRTVDPQTVAIAGRRLED